MFSHARDLNSNYLTARVFLSNVWEPSTGESHGFDILTQTPTDLVVVWNLANIERETWKHRRGTI